MDLFDGALDPNREFTNIADDAYWLPDFASRHDLALMDAIEQIIAQSPLRKMQTPGGYTMSITSSNCGSYGWVSDEYGYRYSTLDPMTGKPWPKLPNIFEQIAKHAASVCGFPQFSPNACVVNQYLPGSRLSLHQDKDERDKTAPIVSISLGLSAIFLFGGKERSSPTHKLRLCHGDVVVWGGKSRLNFHGIDPIANGNHPTVGARRLNLTLRLAK